MGRLEQGWICNLWLDRLQARKKNALLDKYHVVNVRRHDVGIKDLFRGTQHECRPRMKNRAVKKRRDVTNNSLYYRAEIVSTVREKSRANYWRRFKMPFDWLLSAVDDSLFDNASESRQGLRPLGCIGC